MCGIAGVWSDLGRSHVAAVRAMTDAIVHRGPDDDGLYVDGPMALGFRRLSIIDLSGGHQPLSTTDERFTIVFNGEIYNFRELRAELEHEHDEVFLTGSDTEVVLRAYATWGPVALDRLIGMFALAIWDSQEQTLFLARDRLGKKPLYYAHTGYELIFASELKAIFRHPGLTPRLARERVPTLLTYRYVPYQETLFSNVQTLPPGSYLLIRKQGSVPSPTVYWDLSFAAAKNTRLIEDPAEAVAELRALLTDAVRLRMVADVPLGAFLSGGVDSSVIVALMCEMTTEPVKTFSVGFDTGFDESHHAAAVAARFGTDHQELSISADDLMKAIPRALHARESPLTEPSDVPIWLLSELTRKTVTVVLSGEGSDEIFAGYPKYSFEARLGPTMRLLPERLSRLVARSAPLRRIGRARTALSSVTAADRLDGYGRWFGAFDEDERRCLLPVDLADLDVHQAARQDLAGKRFLTRMEEMLYLDTRHYLPANLLLRADRMTMAHSLELRCPFLDHRVVEFAARRIPASMKTRRFTGKWVLRQMASEILPPDIVRRPKWGFKVPVSEWFRGPMLGALRSVLQTAEARDRALLDPATVARLIEDHADGRADYGKQLWTLFQLELWHLMFIDGSLHPDDELPRNG